MPLGTPCSHLGRMLALFLSPHYLPLLHRLGRTAVNVLLSGMGEVSAHPLLQPEPFSEATRRCELPLSGLSLVSALPGVCCTRRARAGCAVPERKARGGQAPSTLAGGEFCPPSLGEGLIAAWPVSEAAPDGCS